jgi:cell division septum initiation protein DivIVA
VAEAEQRAAVAEQRAARATEQADSVRRDADEQAKGLVGTARRNAEQVLAEARQQADKIISDAKAEAERTRRATQRQVDDLIRQRDSITGHLDQLRHLLGAVSGAAAGQGGPSSGQPPAVDPSPTQETEPVDRTITLPAQPAETAAKR